MKSCGSNQGSFADCANTTTELPSHPVISPNNFSPEPFPGCTIMYSKFLFLYTFHKTLFQEFVNYEK